MIDRSPGAEQTTHSLDTGDALATQGRWHDAIDAWQQAVQDDSSTQEAVERRLRWLLAETGTATNERRYPTLYLVSGSAATALIGTVCILIAGTPGSTSANVLAGIAWVLFAASAVLAVVAARGRTTADTDELLQHARIAVDRLETEPLEPHEELTT